MKQQRAARTRESLLQAAAAAFDQDGYEGASLGRVCAAAGISMGALTFHFASKDALADAVRERGLRTVRAALARLTAHREADLGAVVAVTLELARLLEEHPAVRAAARLDREHAGGAARWLDAWCPDVQKLLDGIPEHELEPGQDPDTVLALVGHLVAGAEAHVRSVPAGARRGESAAAQLAQIWALVLRGVSPGGRVPSA